jgi:hypothetical protein
MSTSTVSDNVTLKDCTRDQLVEEVERRGLEGTWDEVSDISEFSDQEVKEEYRIRFCVLNEDVVLSQIYETFRTRGDAPPELRNYLEERIGRILP